jgi:hypothetical protein
MKTQKEQWKAIAECNGEYHISDYGRVKSYKRGKERILKPVLLGRPGNQYLAIGICINGKLKMHKIHRLVALEFISNPENKPQVNHKDGNKLNNHIGNLEWMTNQENQQHAWDSGLKETIRLAASKPVVDVATGKKYDSLKLACQYINEPYGRHHQRHYIKSPLQRFFFVN